MRLRGYCGMGWSSGRIILRRWLRAAGQMMDVGFPAADEATRVWGRIRVGPVPLVNLKAQHAAVAEEVAAGWQEVLARTAFVGGPQVDAFEREYADFSGVQHCIGVANGTDAIEIALRGLGDRGGRRVHPAGQHLHRDRRGGAPGRGQRRFSSTAPMTTAT